MISAGRFGYLLLVGCMLSMALGCVPQDTRISTVPRPAPPAERFSVYKRPQADLGPTTAPLANPRPQTDLSQPQRLQGQIQPMSPDWFVAGGQRWTHIIVHHSSENKGNAALYDRAHRQRGWDELGYHFVITNGVGGPDGKVEVGPRWPIQKHGAHTRVSTSDDNYWNRFGIGICLVGNFNSTRPTRLQMESAARLIAYLQQQYGISDKNILGHGQVPGAKTDCPGRLFPYSELMHRVRAVSPVATAAR